MSSADSAADQLAERLAPFGIRPPDAEMPILAALRDHAASSAAALASMRALPAPDFPPGRDAMPASIGTTGSATATTDTSSRRGPFGPLASITEIAERLARGETTSSDLVEELLEHADRIDGNVGAYLARFDDTAREAAKHADDVRASGAGLGALHGIPIALKDLIATREAPTTAQSRVAAFTEAFDARCVEKLRDAGAIILGKTTLNEHATGLIDRNGPFPVTCNPWDLTKWAGGSSSGSGAGVAAGLFPAAIGTDTGGSVRIPAAVCGIAGFKPTYGAVDTTGVAPLSWTLDTVGPLATTVADCALLHAVMAGRDYDVAPARTLHGLRVGVDESWAAASGVHPDVTAAFAHALEVLEATGAKLVPIDLAEHTTTSLAGSVAQAVEAFEHHRENLANRWDDYGPGTRPYLVTGAFYSGADYVRAQRVRTAAARTLESLPVDLYVSPTIGIPAPPLDGDHAALIPLFFTSLWNAVGFPALSVPMGPGATTGLPLGLQIAGPRGADHTVLTAGDAYERASRPGSAVA
jgi:aspartyl-tRNA(Asn)/glutamyl-tRNA(Gln) amidotransferase subunit A